MNGLSKNNSPVIRYVNITLLVLVLISSIYLYRVPKNRTFAVIVFLLTFAWLYAYVVKRRTTRRK